MVGKGKVPGHDEGLWGLGESKRLKIRGCQGGRSGEGGAEAEGLWGSEEGKGEGSSGEERGYGGALVSRGMQGSRAGRRGTKLSPSTVHSSPFPS